jgi:hypothetical protein
MSVPSNKTNWQPTIPVDQSIYAVSTEAKAPLGTRIEVGDRVFYYAQASASVNAGQVLCSTSPTASHQSGILAVAATSADAKAISATSSADVAANLYEEGYFGEAAGAGEGQLYRVLSNSSGGAGFEVVLYDRLQTAITSGTGYFLVQNKYKNVFVGSEALDAPVGVAPVNVTSGAYFWLQTWGPAAPHHVAATPAAAALRLGTTGGVSAFSATGTLGSTGFALVDYVTIIGKNSPLAATAGESNPVTLTIER